MSTSLPIRFREKFVVDDETGCWNWTANLNNAGYGKIWCRDRKKKVYAHRFAYEVIRGPIPDGLVLDHLCRNPKCCNPEHLEAVTFAENLRRGEGGLRRQQLMAARTHCIHGHELTEENTYRHRGARHCRACRRAHDAGRNPAHEPMEKPESEPVTHCKRGHEFTPENTRVNIRKSTGRSERACRACAHDRYMRSKRAKTIPGGQPA